MNNFMLDKYENNLKEIRDNLTISLSPILREHNTKNMLLFWIISCLRAVPMTEPVENWIKRAGESSLKLGFMELGAQLIMHAKHEANHHIMMIEDVKNLIRLWNNKYNEKLDIDELNKNKFSKYVIAYRELHEDYIRGPHPYCQIAIEYEIENLSTTLIKRLMERSIKILGTEIIKCLSFVSEHIKLDVGHTEYNKRCLNKFMHEYPDKIDYLIEAGSKALNIYKNFLFDNYDFALKMKSLPIHLDHIYEGV